MGYTKIKKINDSFESLNSLIYGEDFLREYNNFCQLVDSIPIKVSENNREALSTDTLYGYTNFIVIPVLGKLLDYVDLAKSVNKLQINEDLKLALQNLYKVSKLYKDRGFNQSYDELTYSYSKLLSNFTKQDKESGFFKETGINNFLDTILDLANKQEEIPKDLFLRLKYYNLYPVLEHFTKEVTSKNNILNATRNNLFYEEILSENKDSKDEMLITAKQVCKLFNEGTTKKSTIKIEGLKSPVKWENITLQFDGDIIKIKQSDTLLAGELFLEDIGIHKSKKKGAKTSPSSFFMSLFMELNSDLLNSTNNLNQQNKMTVSKALKELFSTSEDPIHIISNKYAPKFKVALIGPLAEIDIDHYRSGGTLYDGTTNYENNIDTE